MSNHKTFLKTAIFWIIIFIFDFVVFNALSVVLSDIEFLLIVFLYLGYSILRFVLYKSRYKLFLKSIIHEKLGSSTYFKSLDRHLTNNPDDYKIWYNLAVFFFSHNDGELAMVC